MKKERILSYRLSKSLLDQEIESISGAGGLKSYQSCVGITHGKEKDEPQIDLTVDA